MRVITKEAIISIEDDCYMVENFSKRRKMKEGFAYILSDGLVYPYMGKYDAFLSNKPGIYDDKKAKTYKIVPIPSKKEKYYLEERVIELDPMELINQINNDPEFADAATIEEALSNGDLLQPIIKEDDDFLKYLIKAIVLKKKVSRSQYRKRFSKSHEFPNLIQSLERDTKMTVTNFKRWAELLGFEWKIIVTDPEDPEKYSDISVSSADY